MLLGPPGTGKTHLATAPGHRRRPPRPPGAVRHRDRLGHPPHRRPPRRPAPRTSSTRLRRYGLIIVDEVGYLPFEQDAANLFFQLVSSRYEHASLILTSQPAVQRLGRRLRRPGRRRRDDRPHRPPRRRPHPQRRQLPAPQPRHRHPAQHQNSTEQRVPRLPKPLTFQAPKPSSFRAPSTPLNVFRRIKLERLVTQISHRGRPTPRVGHPCPPRLRSSQPGKGTTAAAALAVCLTLLNACSTESAATLRIPGTPPPAFGRIRRAPPGAKTLGLWGDQPLCRRWIGTRDRGLVREREPVHHRARCPGAAQR